MRKISNAFLWDISSAIMSMGFHRCDPMAEAVLQRTHVFLDALRVALGGGLMAKGRDRHEATAVGKTESKMI